MDNYLKLQSLISCTFRVPVASPERLSELFDAPTELNSVELGDDEPTRCEVQPPQFFANRTPGNTAALSVHNEWTASDDGPSNAGTTATFSAYVAPTTVASVSTSSLDLPEFGECCV